MTVGILATGGVAACLVVTLFSRRISPLHQVTLLGLTHPVWGVDSSKFLGHFVLEQQTIDPVIACFTSSMATQADTIGRTAVPLPPPVNDALQSPVKCRAIYARVDMSTAVCLTAPVYAAMLLW